MTSAVCLQASQVAVTARTPFGRMFESVIGGPDPQGPAAGQNRQAGAAITCRLLDEECARSLLTLPAGLPRT